MAEKKAPPAAEEVKSPVAKIEKSPSISNFKSVKDLENLTEVELRDILKRYAIDPGQYTLKHELHYAVLLLWNSAKLAAKEGKKNTTHSTPGAPKDQKTDYVTSWLLKYNDIVIPQRAMEVQQQPKPQASTSEQVHRMADNSAAIQQLKDEKGETTRRVIGSSEQVHRMADNSAAIQQLKDEKGEATRGVIGSAPAMGTQLGARRKQKTEAETTTEGSKPVQTKSGQERHRTPKTEKLAEINNPTSGIIYSQIVKGPPTPTYGVPLKVVAKMERQAEVVYAELATRSQHFPTAGCSSIMSFGDKIAPASTELEFAFIDDTISEASVNQGTRNERKTSDASSYYSKLIDGRYAK